MCHWRTVLTFQNCRLVLVLSCFAVWFTQQRPIVAADPQWQFNRDIRPLLSDHCFACHGPDEKSRQAGLRLDQSDAATATLPSERVAIVPGQPEKSEILRRITSTDPSEQMPPAESGKSLTAAQVETLKQWITQGAVYQPHWAFVSARRPQVPAVTGPAEGPIDAFIQDRLHREGLSMSPRADKERLLRRVTLDLTGTPPTLAEIDDFLTDSTPDAYERVVDRLMASPRYGERMALDWLDAARYADTHGFNNDTTRSMWRWRDWTIQAFNAGMPFDQFVTDQLAGDLLPNPTLDQLIATGFNRNHVINSEGGIIGEEYRVEYVADRVHTTATVFLGLSMGCARCHDHKFDPLTQRDYYQFFAFFNQLNEQGEAGRVGNAEPQIPAPTEIQREQQSALRRELELLDRWLDERTKQTVAAAPNWEPRLLSNLKSVPGPGPLLRIPFNQSAGNDVIELSESPRTGHIVGQAAWVAGKLDGAIKLDGSTHVEAGDVASFERTDAYTLAAWINIENKDGATVISRMDDADAFRGFDLLLAGGKLTAHLIHHWPDDALHVVTKSELPVNQWKHVCVTYDGSSTGEGLRLFVDGVPQEVEITNNRLTATTITAKPLRIGRRTDGAPFRGLIDDVRIYSRALVPGEVQLLAQDEGLSDVLSIPTAERTEEQQRRLASAFLRRFDPEFVAMSDRRQERDEQTRLLDKLIPSAMVMREMPEPRTTYMLKRGQYDAPGEPVQADVPASLIPLPTGAPRNRLGLAQWLLAPDHPLTSRVAVNRAWALFFGSGIVETVEDFGSQGVWPTHLDLLDWLAVEFAHPTNAAAATNWDVKRLHRALVDSATYRQSSRVTPELLERDPANKLLARGPRFRLPAEMIRDEALAMAGLLTERVGGPSVSPYQPAGLWDDVAVGADYEGTVYKQDHGDNLYRRGMYTFWKRTCPPPGLNTFDAPEREFCLARRSRTNTPLQALVLMNDPTFLEAARKLAERTLERGGNDVDARLTYAFRTILTRSPTKQELRVLQASLTERLTAFQNDPTAAQALINVGESSRNPALQESDLAAWTTIISMLLNLDETITKS